MFFPLGMRSFLGLSHGFCQGVWKKNLNQLVHLRTVLERRIRVTGKGFLKHMVRRIVGLLVEARKGDLLPGFTDDHL